MAENPENALDKIEIGAELADVMKAGLAFIDINELPTPKLCCKTCEETHRMISEIYEGISKIAPVLASVQSNPMAKMMARNMGLDLDAMNDNK